ncbi:unnamed protein product [Caenorhabditis auriculariae]|uniref:ARID domain-containing protein n=1 Tax=Caenorhabditis auriculariae TaxID=2777116 RepID=A0A8S1HU24_9PELO|nr:unnamed protein product [Caenorhabditis auriculariae]
MPLEGNNSLCDALLVPHTLSSLIPFVDDAADAVERPEKNGSSRRRRQHFPEIAWETAEGADEIACRFAEAPRQRAGERSHPRSSPVSYDAGAERRRNCESTGERARRKRRVDLKSTVFLSLREGPGQKRGVGEWIDSGKTAWIMSSEDGGPGPDPSQDASSNGASSSAPPPAAVPTNRPQPSPQQQPGSMQPPDWAQASPRPPIPEGAMPHPAMPHGYPPHGYPYMPPRGPFPPYGAYPGGFPPGYPGAQQPQHMMRPPHMPPDMVRMPPGPTPTEWAAQQQAAAAAAAHPQPAAQKLKQEPNPATPASLTAPSPSASSIAEESLDEKPRMESPSWSNSSAQRPTMGPPPVVPAGMYPPAQPSPAQQPPATPQTAATPAGTAASTSRPPPASAASKADIIDRLVGPVTAANPARVMPERRAFFERLVMFCEQHGEPITMVPQVSKQNIDLHRLYIAVRNRGGFQQVTKDKSWKSICSEANPELSESSAAGYQLRRHYQKHLLMLECVETGRNPDDEVAFADKLKRQRRKDPPANATGAAQQPPPNFPG